MQISRHWRLNAQRYRLEGVRYESGAVNLQERTQTVTLDEQETVETEMVTTDKPQIVAA